MRSMCVNVESPKTPRESLISKLKAKRADSGTFVREVESDNAIRPPRGSSRPADGARVGRGIALVRSRQRPVQPGAATAQRISDQFTPPLSPVAPPADRFPPAPLPPPGPRTVGDGHAHKRNYRSAIPATPGNAGAH